MSKYQIVFFSGTGCTKLVADCLNKTLTELGHDIVVERIKAGGRIETSGFDKLILLYPLHSFNAPEPVEEWIQSLEKQNGAKAAVISVSGAGDMTPNTASRVRVIKMLEEKGCDVFYENDITMLSNTVVTTPEPMAIKLIQILPEKVSAIAGDILSEKIRRPKPFVFDRLYSTVGKMERRGAKSFGKAIKASDACDGCGLCAKQCTSDNISIFENRPVFGGKCNLCLGCFYACPRGALYPIKAKIFVLKEFKLDDIVKKATESERIGIDQIKGGPIWNGVKKYLREGKK